MNPRQAYARKRAFTLVELLVTISIIAVLGAISLAGYSQMLGAGRRTAEISAAKQAITAYMTYAGDNSGRLMPGICDKNEKVTGQAGGMLPAYVAKRWPIRLAPYFDYNYDGVAVVNETADAYRSAGDPGMAEYTASVSPALGLNTTFVGGNFQKHFSEPRADNDRQTYGNFAVTRLGQAVAPNKLIVFVSAAQGSGSNKTQGNFYALSPRLGGSRWSDEYNESADASSFGYVHPRWGGQAVVANLDGSVELLDTEQLKDMTRWSNQAAKAGNPDWNLTAK